MKGLEVWITGLRREQSVTRVDMQMVEWDENNNLLKPPKGEKRNLHLIQKTVTIQNSTLSGLKFILWVEIHFQKFMFIICS
jgi:3'-phosphoadenosine 5'-phosphosulfate sulfotransferase (PAPS reductase)/FAD synthetase